jgi:hypothetical protein
MWFIEVVGPLRGGARQSGEAASAQAHIACDVKAHSAVLQLKKRRVEMLDAPSNRTFGNCLLGPHCSQKDLAGTRADAGFPAVVAI